MTTKYVNLVPRNILMLEKLKTIACTVTYYKRTTFFKSRSPK